MTMRDAAESGISYCGGNNVNCAISLSLSSSQNQHHCPWQLEVRGSGLDSFAPAPVSIQHRLYDRPGSEQPQKEWTIESLFIRVEVCTAITSAHTYFQHDKSTSMQSAHMQLLQLSRDIGRRWDGSESCCTAELMCGSDTLQVLCAAPLPAPPQGRGPHLLQGWVQHQIGVDRDDDLVW